jgi:hypothetical protein
VIPHDKPEDRPAAEPSVGRLRDLTEPLALNCPKCPRKMRFVRTTAGGVHLFACTEHGEWHLGYGGLYPPDDLPSSAP